MSYRLVVAGFKLYTFFPLLVHWWMGNCTFSKMATFLRIHRRGIFWTSNRVFCHLGSCQFAEAFCHDASPFSFRPTTALLGEGTVLPSDVHERRKIRLFRRAVCCSASYTNNEFSFFNVVWILDDTPQIINKESKLWELTVSLVGSAAGVQPACHRSNLEFDLMLIFFTGAFAK